MKKDDASFKRKEVIEINENSGKGSKNREEWTNEIDFFMSALGYASKIII